ncbi:hypothetical protein [Halorarius litoreus]|uniref:hypothetical protein n=1 Tax=Halorarius litoreus TaxID=2962676 RepID=UPI0020CF8236|nr:hypothetical protein [Halorarius litoreus]
MKDPQTASTFAGLDGRTDTDLPAWYTDLNDVPDPTSFSEAIRSLPRATSTEVAYKNPYTDEWIETERFNALVEPNRLITQAGDQDEEPLFHVPTSNYAVINPTDVYAPLEDVLCEETVDDTPLAELVFGEVRQYRGGGEVHMDIMFDGLDVTLPDRREPITMGVTTGYDFFGNNAVYVEGFARDTACANSIRSLTDRQVVKHVGDVGDFEQWWRDVLGQLELVANDLHGFIADAQDLSVDLTEMPFDLPEFYDLLGFPEYLAERAAEDARANAADPFDIDMWTLHSGATHALTHFFRGKEGSSLQQYVRLANDLLFNLETSLQRVETSYEQRVEAESEGDQQHLAAASGLAQIERVSEEVHDLADQFEQREAQLRERLDAVAE